MRGVAANPAAPSEVLLRLLDPAAETAWTALCGERALPADVVEAVIAHPRREVRRRFARNRHVPPAQRGRLVDDPDSLVRADLASGPRPRLAREKPLPDDVLETLLTARDDPDHDQVLTTDEIRQELAFSGQIPQSFRRGMLSHGNPVLRAQTVGLWLWLTSGERDALLTDPDPVVRDAAREASVRAPARPLPRTWPRRAVLDRVADRTAARIGPLADMFREPEPRWYEECARSARPLLRRAAATWPGLPEDLVTRLAGDPDPDVRHLLAFHHPHAPPGVVLDAFVAIPCERPYLLTLPGLPRTGLRHLVGHDDPEVRALAAADPTLDEPPVGLLGDPDARVRRAAATNPLLPPDVIATLLHAPESAEGAAANPALPADRLHALLDHCGVPGTAAPQPRRPG
jgi:hypothetical protein